MHDLSAKSRAPPREPAQIKMCTPQPHPNTNEPAQGITAPSGSLAASAPSPFLGQETEASGFFHAALLDVQVQKEKCRPSQIIQFTRPILRTAKRNGWCTDSQALLHQNHWMPATQIGCHHPFQPPFLGHHLVRISLAPFSQVHNPGGALPFSSIHAQGMPPSYSSFRATSRPQPSHHHRATSKVLCRIQVEGPSRTDLSNSLSLSLCKGIL